jgi:hypothetical protein
MRHYRVRGRVLLRRVMKLMTDDKTYQGEIFYLLSFEGVLRNSKIEKIH